MTDREALLMVLEMAKERVLPADCPADLQSQRDRELKAVGKVGDLIARIRR